MSEEEDDKKSGENGPEENGSGEQGASDQTDAPKERKARTGEREAVVGGEWEEEESASGGRPLVYDVLGGVVLLLVIFVALYFYLGTGGQPEGPEPRQDRVADREPAETADREPALDQPPPVEEWSPAEFRMPPPQQADDVDVALEEARAAMEAGRLIEPEGDSALAAYRSVLESEPDNEAAQEGINEIVSQLVSQANEALDDGRVRDALELVSAVETIRPDADGLADLQARVEQSRERPPVLRFRRPPGGAARFPRGRQCPGPVPAGAGTGSGERGRPTGPTWNGACWNRPRRLPASVSSNGRSRCWPGPKPCGRPRAPCPRRAKALRNSGTSVSATWLAKLARRWRRAITRKPTN